MEYDSVLIYKRCAPNQTALVALNFPTARSKSACQL
jgi:hypothetical protein